MTEDKAKPHRERGELAEVGRDGQDQEEHTAEPRTGEPHDEQGPLAELGDRDD